MKTKAIKIEIGFSESPHIKEGFAPVFDSMAKANQFFFWQNKDAETAKENGKLLGYYKTDFTIHFADGTKYEGRYDIGADQPDLTSHVKRFCEVYSGQRKPLQMTEAHWQAFMSQYTQEQKDYHAGILANYDLES